MKCYILFNRLSGNRLGADRAIKAADFFADYEISYIDILESPDYRNLFCKMDRDDIAVLCGGDGTLNHFVNDIDEHDIRNSVYYYPTGSGNDFYRDIHDIKVIEPVRVNDYIRNLPTVTVGELKRKFINGIGYGLDGFCCEQADLIREKKPNRKISYTIIALKGFAGKYSPADAVIIADGKKYEFADTWIASAMNGRYYGGGLMATPGQDRCSRSKRHISCMVIHGKNRLAILPRFPTVKKGKHLKYRKMVAIIEAKELVVSYNRPVPLQIDGETVSGVTSFRVNV